MKPKQQIDSTAIIRGLLSRIDIVVIFFIIGIALFLSKKIFDLQGAYAVTLRSQIAEVDKQNAILGDIKVNLAQIQKVLPTFKEVDTNTFIEEISSLARKFNLQVISVSPQEPKKKDAYFSVLRCEISLGGAYDDVYRFCSAIESAAQCNYIKEISFQRSAGKTPAVAGGLGVELTIERIILSKSSVNASLKNAKKP